MNKGILRGLACPFIAASMMFTVGIARASDELVEAFQNPPAEAKPHTWWHWMNGNISKEGITADLEAMKRVGIGGAQIFNVGSGIPAGPVVFMSAEWREMMKHAVREADRLGLELCLHNCAGWSSSGGPWNTPENAMQTVVSSETRVEGGKHFSGKLPQPFTRLGHYRDIAVLAFPGSGREDWRLAPLKPKVTASGAKVSVGKLVDGRTDELEALPMPASGKPSWVSLEFAEPVKARTLVLGTEKDAKGTNGFVSVSDDGRTFKTVRKFTVPQVFTGVMYLNLGDEPVSGRFYRIGFTAVSAKAKRLRISEIGLLEAARIEGLEAKGGFSGDAVSAGTVAKPSKGQALDRNRIIDLTRRMKADGTLEWDAPAGDWIVQRIGHTPTGKSNHPAPEGGLGPECDKMSTTAFDAHWAGMMQKIIDDVGPLAGKTLKMALIDSYEVGGQNWTPRFREEFRARREYDPLRFLPALSGRVVDSPETTERFLWDMRRTIADLFAEKYFGHFAKVCHARGMLASIEPYGGPFEALQSGAPADVPMGEFWVGGNGHMSVRLAASVAHIYGRTLVAAEAFTARPPDFGRWQEDPNALKMLGDLVFSQGVNRLVFHRYAHQPWMDRLPGMTMGQWGTHFDRTNTWWEQGRAWMTYLARSQYLLQRGAFVADVAYFCGENAPVAAAAAEPVLPQGFDFDSINADVLLHRAMMRDGRLWLAGGPQYRVLVLPPAVTTMTPKLLRRIRDHVQNGLILVGAAPQRSPSLEKQPAADAGVAEVVRELWGDQAQEPSGERTIGRGRVVWGRPLAEVLASAKMYPDFEYDASGSARLVYLHRRDGAADIYFVSNQRRRAVEAEVTFRVTGRVPELFDAETGSVSEAPVWREEAGRTKVRLSLAQAGSVFVVFRKPAEAGDRLVRVTNVSDAGATQAKSDGRLRLVSARYEAVEGEGGKDVTDMLAALIRDGVLQTAVDNKVFGKDPTPNRRKQLRLEYMLNGKPMKLVVPEHGQIDIAADEGAGSAPTLEIAKAADGRVEATLWSAQGAIEWRRESGKTGRIPAPAGIVSRPVEGPWTVSFPAGWGAPERTEFTKLISWTESTDGGIRYFSGTATYTKEIEVAKEWLGAGRVLALDLGRVVNLAEVKLNGKSLGILWKPPFVVRLGDAAVAGPNVLEVKVTNTWANRLIGDEQLPADCEWEGLQLKEVPSWVKQGKPSPTGRKTFTTWHHWTKDMAPLESGLFGPVILRVGGKVAVP